MDIRYAIHPDHMKSFDSDNIRKHFLIERLFEKDKMNMVYSHIDRIIVGGVCPADKELELKVTKELGVDSFLQRREMGIINIGSKGIVSVDGKEYILEKKGMPLYRHGFQGSIIQELRQKQPGQILFQQHSGSFYLSHR